MPLFHPKIITNYTKSCNIVPAAHAAILTQWAASLAQKVFNRETSHDSEFIQRILIDVLGYTGSSSGNHWTLSKNQPVGAGNVDIALGHFTANSIQIISPFELKGAKTRDLDAIIPGRNKSPVQQAWEYAMDAKGAKWVLVSNYREIRLYAFGHGRKDYENFDLTTLTDPAQYARFMLLLAAENLLGNRTAELLKESENKDKEISDQFYKDYQKLRIRIIETLAQDNPTLPILEIIAITQTILDRIIFVAFAEDKGLLPKDTLKSCYDDRNKWNPQPAWENFKGLFNSINHGNPPLNIPGYNGGLFASDEKLNNLIVNDALCSGFKIIGGYDFDSEISVNILGHIFEQSITDLEEIKADLQNETVAVNKKSSKRKRDGIFYTPTYITRYIVEQAVGGWLKNRKQEIGFDKLPALTDADYASIQLITRGVRKGSVTYNANIAQHITAWEAYKTTLSNIKVLDPACGSGAFLNEVFDYLYREGQAVNRELTTLNANQAQLFPWDTHILAHNLYGVDINRESVEITKLSLWLKTANRNEKLTYLENNIKCGNSLIDDPAIAGERAFKWETQFAAIMIAGGFDVVVGNPPYLRLQGLKDAHYSDSLFYEKTYSSAVSNYDIYVLFLEKSYSLLATNGVSSFILPHKWLVSEFGTGIREFFVKHKAVETIDHFESELVFKVTTYTCITQLSKKVKDGILFRRINPKQLLENSVPYDLINYEILNNKSWNLTDNAVASVLNKIKQQPLKISDIFEKIFVGIQTSADNVYLIKGKKDGTLIRGYSKQLDKEVSLEAGIMKPLLKGEDVSRYQPLINQYYVIFPYHLNNDKAKAMTEADIQRDFPKAYNYLKENETVLRNRENGKMNIDNWFLYIYPKSLTLFEKSKIITAEISLGTSMSYDKNGDLYHTTTVYSFIKKEHVSEDYRYFLTLLNSSVLWFFLKQTGNVLRGGYFRFQTKYLLPFPLPNPPDDINPFIEKAEIMLTKNQELHELSAQFIELLKVEFNLDKLNTKLQEWYTLEVAAFIAELTKELKKKKMTLNLEQKNEWMGYFKQQKERATELKNTLDTTDREIDQMVYALYGLTLEEIALIEVTE